MKTLERVFEGRGEVSGVVFTQIYRYNDYCIYKRSDGYYEVIRVRHQKASMRVINGTEVFYEEKERYPKGDEWENEYCCHSIEWAIKRFNQQMQRLNYGFTLTVKELTIF